MHELTHLDSLGAVAGLDAPTSGPDAGLHGTEDLQSGFGLSGARDYKEEWEDSEGDENSPDYNAESYAATATGMSFKFLSSTHLKGPDIVTEFFFMNVCHFQEIPQ